jgi:hypothetical protein
MEVVMGRIASATLALFVATAGCTHRHALPPPGDLARESVVVRLADGRQVPAQGITAPDAVRFRLDDGRVLTAAEVTEVVQVKRWRGAAEGLGLGIASGVVLGGLTGLSMGSDPHCSGRGYGPCWSFSAGEKAFYLGALLGVAGGILGTLAGVATGSTDVYGDPSYSSDMQPSAARTASISSYSSP